ncbi:MAG: hypothetical protein GY941_11690 [Planctomycetes bacterium]|nr:hypothetical protein [Planctomycetota bacterium]
MKTSELTGIDMNVHLNEALLLLDRAMDDEDDWCCDEAPNCGCGSDKSNQCQGCQAGWKVKKHNPWPKGSKPMYFHIVEGGYDGELCVCTRDNCDT